jgi:hypothetical protein
MGDSSGYVEETTEQLTFAKTDILAHPAIGMARE